MLKNIFFLFCPFLLLASEVVWQSDSKVALSYEQIQEAMNVKYPDLMAAWQEQKLAIENSVVIGRLMWQDNEDTETINLPWQEAHEYCQNLKLLGFTNWRLPSIQELESIVDKARFPSAKKELRHIKAMEYWSLTPCSSCKTPDMYLLSFKFGRMDINTKTNKNFVRCVRRTKY